MTTPDLVVQTIVDVTITPTKPGITLNVASDPLLTVPFNGAQLPTAFNAAIHNNGPTADTYNLTFSNLPSGFTLLDSGTTDTIPAGATGSLGLYLQPNPGQPIAAPGTPLSFTVTATSTTDPSITRTQVETFTVPAIDGVTATVSPTALTSTAGTPATTTLTLANVGNVAENVTLSSTLPTGLTATGLGPVTIQPGTSTTVTISFTPDATVSLNSTLAATITATYGPSSAPRTTSAQVNLTVRSQEVVALQQAVNAAGGIPGSQGAATLANLADALSQLQGDPTNASLLGRVQFLLGNLSTLLQADPALTTFVTGLQPLQTAASAGDVTGLLAQTTAFFNNLASVLAQEADEQFTAALSPTEADLQPGEGKTFNLQLTSQSHDPVSLTIGVGALPGGVTVVPGQTQVTLAPGQTITVPVTLSQTIQSTKVFTLDVTAKAALVEDSATAVVAIRPASADVLGVTVTPPTPDAGAPVSVTAQVFNTANAARNVVAKLDLLDASGNLVSTPAQVPVALVPGAGNLTLNLGQVATTGLANGLYSLRVSLLTTDGSPLPGQSSQTDFEVGQPVTASIASGTSIVPPGTSTVTTTITVTNQTVIPTGGSGGSQTGPSSITLELGYADNILKNPFFPSPWFGSPNTVFVGDKVMNLGEYDGGALRIINNGNTPITVNDVSVTFANGAHYDLWGSNVVPAGDNLILAQTNGQNFDTSDVDASLSFPNTYPDGETAHAAKINITVNGVLLPTFLDTGHILTTGGSDLAAQGANESQNWRPVGTTGVSNPGGLSTLVTVTHNLPTSGYTVDLKTISPAPSTTSSSQLVWKDELIGPVADSGPGTFQLSGTVTNMAPGEVRQISLGTSVVSTIAVSGQQLMTTIPLAPLTVAADHIISIDPPAQTADRDAAATYQVTLTNLLATSETYTLSTDGLAGFTTNLAATVNVGPGQTVTTPLTVTVPLSETAGTQVFTVFAKTSEGGIDSVEGQLTVSPQVALPTQAVNVQLVPTLATAGLGTSATYEVVVTNLGDTSDTYALSGSFPAGVTATFAEPTLTVPPGQGNLREVLLTLTPQPGSATGDQPFTVTAISTTNPSVMSSANGTVTVLPSGVGVTLNPSSGAPGSGFQTTVTNTGSVADTFDLALAGPAALVASLGTSQVTLAPGASQVVPITTSAVNFAVPGALQLTATATSHANPAVQAGASANLTIAATEGLTARFQTPSQVLAMLGTSPFLLLVNNSGNTEDSYSATITGTSGPVSASLTGLDGQPAQSISLFRLPGLSSGSIVLPVNLTAFGQGTVTVKVQSLSDPTETATATATVSATGATTTQLAATPNPATVGQPVTFTATVSAQSGTVSPPGTVTFTIDGQAQMPDALQVINGVDQAVFTDSALAAGPHAVTASYSGDPAFVASTAMPLTETVNKQTSTTTLAAAPDPSTVGQAVTLTATVTPATGTGTVDFMDTTTGTDLGTAPVTDGIATLPPVALAVGDHAIIATYSGDPSSTASTSGSSTVRVVPIVTTTGLSVAPNPSTVGQPVTFTATVAPTSGAGTPTGAVIFTIDGAPQSPVALKVADNVVQATFATATLGVGPHQVSASYSGGASFASSSAGPVTLIVKAASPGGTTIAPTATTVQAEPDPAPFGQAITLSATVARGSGSRLPTGTVTFSVDGAAQAPVPLQVVNGKPLATLSIPGSSAGPHQIEASYSGDAHFAFSVSTAITLVVNPASVVTPPVVDGPRVTDVRRYGYHWALTPLVLNFNEPLDPARAQFASNYRIIGPAGLLIPVKTAVYDPTTLTVTLHPSQRLDVHKRYVLIVNGEGPLGLTDTSGNLLDGNGQGKPGVSYVTTVTIHNLVFGRPTPTIAPRISAGFGRREAAFRVPTGSWVTEHVVSTASTPVRATIHRTPSVKPPHHK